MVLDGLTLDIPENSIFGFLGPKRIVLGATTAILIAIAAAMLVATAALAWLYGTQRDGDGYVTSPAVSVSSDGYAIAPNRRLEAGSDERRRRCRRDGFRRPCWAPSGCKLSPRRVRTSSSGSGPWKTFRHFSTTSSTLT